MLIHKIENRLKEERYVDRYQAKLAKLLDKIDTRLARTFKKANREGRWSNAELAKYNRDMKLRDQIRREVVAYRRDVTRDYRDDLARLYKNETLFTQDMLRNIPQLGITNELNTLPTQAIKSEVVDAVQIKGKTMVEYVRKYGQDVAFRVEQEVFESVALGEHPRKTTRRLRHLEQSMSNRVEMTVRSWNNAIYNRANDMVYDQAGIEKLLYLATLDIGTCPECAVDHNKIFRRDEIILLPRHPQCRCTYAPYIAGMVEEARSYTDWLGDGRRSDAQLEDITGQIRGFMRRGRITKREGNHLLGIIGSVTQQRSR